MKVNPVDADTMSMLAHYHANVGEREQSLQYLAKATALAPQNFSVYYTSATALAALGDMDRAMQALEKAIELGYAKYLVRADAGLAVLRQQPGFDALTAE